LKDNRVNYAAGAANFIKN